MRGKSDYLPYGYTMTVMSNGQFTIPKALRLKLGIRSGDTVEIKVIDGDTIVVRPLKPVRVRMEAA